MSILAKLYQSFLYQRLVSILGAIILGGISSWVTQWADTNFLTLYVFLPILAILAGIFSTWSP
jgi:hypothetical protein